MIASAAQETFYLASLFSFFRLTVTKLSQPWRRWLVRT